jgi:hypothetical protein
MPDLLPVCGNGERRPPFGGFRSGETAGCFCETTNGFECFHYDSKNNYTFIFRDYGNGGIDIRRWIGVPACSLNRLNTSHMGGFYQPKNYRFAECIRPIGYCDPLKTLDRPCCAVSGCSACDTYLTCSNNTSPRASISSSTISGTVPATALTTEVSATSLVYTPTSATELRLAGVSTGVTTGVTSMHTPSVTNASSVSVTQGVDDSSPNGSNWLIYVLVALAIVCCLVLLLSTAYFLLRSQPNEEEDEVLKTESAQMPVRSHVHCSQLTVNLYVVDNTGICRRPHLPVGARRA